jgi:adenine phosphoribosyltransferase
MMSIPSRAWIGHPKPGVAYRDPSTALADPTVFRRIISDLNAVVRADIDVFAGIDLGGTLLAGALAMARGAGVVEIRKSGTVRPEVVRGAMHHYVTGDGVLTPRGSVRPGARIVVTDDCLISGSTAVSAVRLLRRCGATVEQALFIFELQGCGGREALAAEGVAIHALEAVPALPRAQTPATAK